jgi:nucleoside-diphosphate kinase
MATERTFVMFKPGVLQRRVVGELITRIERKGFNVIALKQMRITADHAKRHYAEHKEKPFFASLVDYITSGPVIAFVLERPDAVRVLRSLIGSTNPDNAQPGTIRGDFGVSTEKNLIHASDSPESAKREIALFFTEAEIAPFEDGNAGWL